MPTINRILSTEDCFDEIFHGTIREKFYFTLASRVQSLNRHPMTNRMAPNLIEATSI